MTTRNVFAKQFFAARHRMMPIQKITERICAKYDGQIEVAELERRVARIDGVLILVGKAAALLVAFWLVAAFAIWAIG